MSLLVGALFGLGLLLALSPWLWPRAPGASQQNSLDRMLRERLAQAGLTQVSPGALGVVSFATAVIAASIAGALLPLPVIWVGTAIAGGALPIWVVGARARGRRRVARAVWPDLVDQIVAALRSGASIGDALGELGSTGPAAMRPAFVALELELRATGDLDDAIDQLKARLADPIGDRIAETVRLAHDVGGSELVPVLRALGAALREEAAVRSEVEARQSWVRTAARVGVAAPWLVLLLLASRPEAVRAYDSPVGGVLLVVGAVVSVVAYRMMIALGRLPEERRWFA